MVSVMERMNKFWNERPLLIRLARRLGTRISDCPGTAPTSQRRNRSRSNPVSCLREPVGQVVGLAQIKQSFTLAPARWHKIGYVALRMGRLGNSGTTVRKIGHCRSCVVGTPSYFAEHGRPNAPGDLVERQAEIFARDGHRGGLARTAGYRSIFQRLNPSSGKITDRTGRKSRKPAPFR